MKDKNFERNKHDLSAVWFAPSQLARPANRLQSNKRHKKTQNQRFLIRSRHSGYPLGGAAAALF
jgi:hypothetical protein